MFRMCMFEFPLISSWSLKMCVLEMIEIIRVECVFIFESVVGAFTSHSHLHQICFIFAI